MSFATKEITARQNKIGDLALKKLKADRVFDQNLELARDRRG
jgi:hypothetical protein